VSRITPCSCAARRYCVLSVTLISVTYLTTGPNLPVSVTAWILLHLISFPRI